MAHDHAHGHAHSHAGHGGAQAGALNAAFLLGALLNTAFIALEVAFGLASHSVSLLADAGHNVGDVLGLFVAWGGVLLAKRAPGPRFTYGLRGTSILAAMFNAIVLLITVGGIAVESVRRLYAPVAVHGATVTVVALTGIAVNGATALLFRRSHQHDLSVRSVFLHMLGDAVISAGVVIAGLGVMLTGWFRLDPAVSLVVAGFLVFSTWDLLKQSVTMALQGVPADIDPEDVRTFLLTIDGVAHVHDLHIWPVSTTERALTCHVVMPKGHPGDAVLAELTQALEARFRIDHATIQIEMEDLAHACRLVGGK